MSAEILNRVEPEFSVDLLVRTPDEVRKRLAWRDPFLGEIMRDIGDSDRLLGFCRSTCT